MQWRRVICWLAVLVLRAVRLLTGGQCADCRAYPARGVGWLWLGAFLNNDHVVFNHQGNFSTATRVAEAINEFIGDPIATPLDATSVRVNAPEDRAQRVAFMGILENIDVDPRGLLPKWLLIRAPALW